MTVADTAVLDASVLVRSLTEPTGTASAWVSRVRDDLVDGHTSEFAFLEVANALLMMRTMEPAPDQVILITDGLPTQGSVPPARKFINAKDREKLFDDALKTVNKDIPIDVVLLPMKGDMPAAYAYWSLARKTGGSYVVPSRDWP